MAKKSKASSVKKDAVYSLYGTTLEACSCNVLCPCWIGEPADNGECLGLAAYHFEAGHIKGVDVSGLTLAGVLRFKGKVTDGNWKIVYLVDERANDEQTAAMIDVFTGKLGGELSDVFQLVGEVLGTEKVSISYNLTEGHGSFSIPGIAEAEMEPYRTSDGTVTTLRDVPFSNIPGGPAWIAKASKYKVSLPKYNMEWEFEGHNAIEAEWKAEHVA
jgi:hypothetical protein